MDDLSSDPMLIDLTNEEDIIKVKKRKRASSSSASRAAAKKGKANDVNVSPSPHVPVLSYPTDLIRQSESEYIPDELWTIVFDVLHQADPPTYIRPLCMQVCRQWYRVYSQPHYWNMEWANVYCYSRVCKKEDLGTDSDTAYIDALSLPLGSEVQVWCPGLYAYIYDPKSGSEVGRMSPECDCQDLFHCIGESPTYFTVTLKSFNKSVHNHETNSQHYVTFRVVFKAKKFAEDYEKNEPQATRLATNRLFTNYVKGVNTGHMRKLLGRSDGSLLIGAKATKPIWKNVLYEQPSNLAPDVKLHPYQVEAMSWMQEVEERLPIQIPYTKRVPFLKGGMPYTTNGKKTYDYGKLQINYFLVEPRIPTKAMECWGGVLGEEMGLGKSRTCIALSMLNRIEVPESLELKKLTPGQFLFTTRASLIVVPNHLPGEWETEIHRVMGPDRVRVVTLTIKNQHTAVTYTDIMRADFVIVTTNFLTNGSHYASALDRLCEQYGIQVGKKPVTSTRVSLTKPELRRNMLFDLMHHVHHSQFSPEFASMSAPLLESFYWQRIFLDESNQERDSSIDGSLQVFQSKARWCISGTPFPSVRSIIDTFTFLGMDVDSVILKKFAPYASMPRADVIKGLTEYVQTGTSHEARAFIDYQTFCTFFSLYSNFTDLCLWRQTKESIRDSFKVPPLKITYMPLEFSPVEKIIYEAKPSLAFCNTHRNEDNILQGLVYDEPFVEEMTEVELKRKTNFRASLPVEKLNEKLMWVKTTFAGEVEYLSKRMTTTHRIFIDYSFWVKEELRAAGQNCSDMDAETYDTYPPTAEVDESQRSMIQHRIFYRDKAKAEWCEAVAEYQKKDEILDRLLATQPITINKRYPFPDQLVAAFGTKVSGTLQYVTQTLKANKENRILLFSTSDDFRKAVGTILRLMRIKCVVIGKGNVHMKNKALREFRQEGSKTRVMLLSTDKNAAGTNLIEASHVVLLDPVKGSASEATAMEDQAIARAYRQGQKKRVEVVRFYIKDTLEEEYVKRDMKVL